MLEELKNLFGLTVKAPDCASADQKLAIETSDSGLYLDQMPQLPLLWVPASGNCLNQALHPKSIFALGIALKTEVLLALESDILTGLNSLYPLKNQPYSGNLGSSDTKGMLPFAEGQVVTTRIKTAEMPGNILRLRTLGLHTTVDAVVPITINGQVYPVTTTANTLNNNVIAPVDIPLNGQDIVIEYTVQGFMVKNNTMCYGCLNVAKKITPYLPSIVNQEGNGLVLGVTFSCQVKDIIRTNYALNDSVRTVMAYAARYKMARFLMDSILNSGEITRYTTMSREETKGKRDYFESEYWNRINWLVSEEGMKLGLEDCFVCKPEKPVYGIRKRGILS